MDIQIIFGKDSPENVSIKRGSFELLFENTHVWNMVPYQKALKTSQIKFTDLVDLARRASVPYSLLFAPPRFIKAQVNRKERLILSGTSKATFSLNSRGSVELRDIAPILKDLIRKQGLLKNHTSLPDHPMVGKLKNSRKSVKKQAEEIQSALKLDLTKFKPMSKKRAFLELSEQLGRANIFVCQSSRLFMPQIIQPHVRFSGLSIRDKKVPFIFLNSKDEVESFEPEGRKILTTVLLVTCIARGKFSPVTYTEQSKALVRDIEYQIAEEILMPEAEMRGIDLSSLELIEGAAATFCVTPSALLMRIRRLRLLSKQQIDDYYEKLKDDFQKKKAPQARTPKPVNGVIKYNGAPLTRAVLKLVDDKKITKNEARNVLFQNRYKDGFLNDLKGSI